MSGRGWVQPPLAGKLRSNRLCRTPVAPLSPSPPPGPRSRFSPAGDDPSSWLCERCPVCSRWPPGQAELPFHRHPWAGWGWVGPQPPPRQIVGLHLVSPVLCKATEATLRGWGGLCLETLTAHL